MNSGPFSVSSTAANCAFSPAGTVRAAQTGPVCASIRSRTAWLRSFQSVRCTVISESLAVEAGNELDFIVTDVGRT